MAEDSQPSESIRHNKEVDPQGFPNFALIEEINKPEPVVFYDVPIKIEETGEGFSPPSEIRLEFLSNTENIKYHVQDNLRSHRERYKCS